MTDETAVTKAKIENLFRYFGEVWFVLYTPDKWSVSKDKRRSNNMVESHNRTFHDRFNTETRNNFWEFISNNFYFFIQYLATCFKFPFFINIEKLQEDEESKRKDFKALQDGQPIGRNRPAVENRRNEDISHLTADLDGGGITLFEFIQEAAAFFEPDPSQRVFYNKSKFKIYSIKLFVY